MHVNVTDNRIFVIGQSLTAIGNPCAFLSLNNHYWMIYASFVDRNDKHIYRNVSIKLKFNTCTQDSHVSLSRHPYIVGATINWLRFDLQIDEFLSNWRWQAHGNSNIKINRYLWWLPIIGRRTDEILRRKEALCARVRIHLATVWLLPING